MQANNRDPSDEKQIELVKRDAQAAASSKALALLNGEGGLSAPPKSGEIILRPLSEYEELQAEFLVTDRIPRGQITLIGGEGGSGKTSLWIDIVAAISSGRPSVLEKDTPFEDLQEPQRVVIFNAEDDLERVLKRRLRAAGANEDNVFSLSLTEKAFSEIKMNSSKIEGIIERYRPALMVFDPLQAFIPPEVNMGARNAMRACLAPLITLGEKYGTAFLIVLHTNKMAGAWGRRRLSDSSDIWDIARSVLMIGTTGDGKRYCSQEKNNFGRMAETILFDVDDDRIRYLGTTPKKDRDFVSEEYQEARSAPARESAENMILSYLTDHEGEQIEIRDFEQAMLESGIAKSTLRRAKESLKESGKIRLTLESGGKDRRWFISIVHDKKSN